MSQRKQINKVSYKDRNVLIEYELLPNVGEESSDLNEIKLKSSDEPLEEFKTALRSLAPHVEKICCLPEGFCNQAEVRGVSFSWSNDIMGAVITTLVPLETANSPMTINTPHLPSQPYSEGGETPVLSDDCIDALKKLLAEAERYINHERKPSDQTKMQFPE